MFTAQYTLAIQRALEQDTIFFLQAGAAHSFGDSARVGKSLNLPNGSLRRRSSRILGLSHPDDLISILSFKHIQLITTVSRECPARPLFSTAGIMRTAHFCRLTRTIRIDSLLHH